MIFPHREDIDVENLVHKFLFLLTTEKLGPSR